MMYAIWILAALVAYLVIWNLELTRREIRMSKRADELEKELKRAMSIQSDDYWLLHDGLINVEKRLDNFTI